MENEDSNVLKIILKTLKGIKKDISELKEPRRGVVRPLKPEMTYSDYMRFRQKGLRTKRVLERTIEKGVLIDIKTGERI